MSAGCGKDDLDFAEDVGGRIVREVAAHDDVQFTLVLGLSEIIQVNEDGVLGQI